MLMWLSYKQQMLELSAWMTLDLKGGGGGETSCWDWTGGLINWVRV